MKLGIFTSFSGQHLLYIKACKELNIDYVLVDLLSNEWIKNVKEAKVDGFLCSSACDFQERKSILDERYYFISQVMKKDIYPTFLPLFIHENKRNMAAWLEINDIPHVPTHVFTDKKEALSYVEKAKLPIISKANIGAGASKVKILKSKRKAKKLIRDIFPFFNRIPFLNYGKIYFLKLRNWLYLPDLSSNQTNYILLQEFKQIKYEWRIIKIGDSICGHQKLLKGQFASGSKLMGWVEPPKVILDLTREICEKGNFDSMDVDIFETLDGDFFVNELQTLFGFTYDYHMKINGVPGRYIYKNNEYIFEPGIFHVNGSMNLRVKDFINKLKEK